MHETYVWRGKWVPKHLAAPRHRVQRLQIIGDIEPFVSPIDGKVVGGRKQKRDHMRAHDVIDTGDEPIYQDKYRKRPQVNEREVAQDVKEAFERLGD